MRRVASSGGRRRHRLDDVTSAVGVDHRRRRLGWSSVAPEVGCRGAVGACAARRPTHVAVVDEWPIQLTAVAVHFDRRLQPEVT